MNTKEELEKVKKSINVLVKNIATEIKEETETYSEAAYKAWLSARTWDENEKYIYGQVEKEISLEATKQKIKK